MRNTIAASGHYQGNQGAAYFAWQNQVGDLGGKLTAEKFLPYVPRGSRVLDFGCGGGWMLKNIPDIERFGVEVNEHAHEQCRKNGVSVANTIDKIDGEFDVVLSNHCLEHVPNPVEALRQIRKKLKPDGRLILCLPIDDWRTQKVYHSNIDHHLYTWTPLLLGNTLTEAGFEPLEVYVRTNAWPPKKELLHRLLPRFGFNLVCRLVAILRRRRELMAVARVGTGSAAA